MENLFFVKLGGSLITDKDQIRFARLEVLHRLADEIKQAVDHCPDLRLVIGHGSGSYGHQSANRHKTIHGVYSQAQWLGFAEVWKDARDLNQIVIDALVEAGLPIVSFPPSAWVITQNRKIVQSFEPPIHLALHSGLFPVIQGDVIFDQQTGGTILSTEDLFFHLSQSMKPKRILLAGVEAGIWDAFPERNRLIPKITPDNFSQMGPAISGSASVDVTGGMVEKVSTMLQLLDQNPSIEILIFSGLQPGELFSALVGGYPGTTLCSK